VRAVVLDGQGGLEVASWPDPAPAPGEAIVRVLVAGICATDLELRRGYMQFRGVPGHEFVGVVERADTQPGLIGMRVVGEINAACGACDLCATGLERHCPARTVLGILGRPGAFAERLALPARNLRLIPDEMPTDRAVFVEPVAAAFEVLEQVDVRGRRCLVLGAGRLGALCARVLGIGGAAHVTVVSRGVEKLAPLARDGIETHAAADVEARRSFDVVVEATGAPTGLEAALRWVRPRGTVVLKTTCAGAHTLNLAPVVVDEVTIVGSRCGPFEPAIRALVAARLRPEETVDARYPLARAAEAFEHALRPGVRKVLVDMEGHCP
jgi:threonine dehydrogenase-like Zn-dependent dehydrogenase